MVYIYGDANKQLPLSGLFVNVDMCLSLIHLRFQAERVCVSVLPLGTGNDLARVCGWGPAIEDDVNLVNLLEKYEVGSPRLLDR